MLSQAVFEFSLKWGWVKGWSEYGREAGGRRGVHIEHIGLSYGMVSISGVENVVRDNMDKDWMKTKK